MNKVKAVCLAVIMLPVLAFCGCKKSPDKIQARLVSYTKNGVVYSKEINAFSLFDQFREDNVEVSFTENNFTLRVKDKEYGGSWKEEKENDYGSHKGATYFSMTDSQGHKGVGYSGHFGFDGWWDELEFTYLDETYTFHSDPHNFEMTENYSLEQELEEECKILNECIEKKDKKYIHESNGCSYYYSSAYYEYGEITKEENIFYFTGYSTRRLNLSKVFFYDYKSSIEYADSIRTGTCVLKSNLLETSYDYAAVFYL